MSAEINNCIQKQLLWSDLPPHIRSKLGDINEYNNAILKYSLQNQLRFKSNLISKIFKSEKKYYEKLINHSKDNMFLYPYHIQDMIVGGLRMSAFSYYVDMLCTLMSEEKSYDFIPNFTAADILRLLAIGRNQYIELMNTIRGSNSTQSNSRSSAASSVMKVGKRFLGFVNDNSNNSSSNKELLSKIRILLPSSPVNDMIIEPWWLVSIGVVFEPDISNAPDDLRQTIDYIIDSGPLYAGTLDRSQLYHLYNKGMVYLDVPIEPFAVVSVPTLEKFVMNRTSGDQFENLLYKIFVTIDENSSVDALAHILEIPLELVQQAVSVFCRLQFAHKKPNNLDAVFTCHKSWSDHKVPIIQQPSDILSEDLHTFLLEDDTLDESHSDSPQQHHTLNSSIKSSNSMFITPSPSIDDCRASTAITNADESPTNSKRRKIAFVFDSSLTAYLMMGNLSAGLKNHAVTMFEVGKLSEEGLNQFLIELESISEVGEGEAQRYYEHAVNLRYTIRQLRQISSSSSVQQAGGLDLLRYGSLLSLDTASRSRMLAHNYRVLVTMAPLCCYTPGGEASTAFLNTNTQSDEDQSSIAAPLSTHPRLPVIGPVIPQISSVWFRLYTLYRSQLGPPSLLLIAGYRIRMLPDCLANYNRLLLTPWQQESIIVPCSTALVTINDGLTHGPLLVQGYDLDIPLVEKQIAFPIIEEDVELKKTCVRQIVKKLNCEFDLSNKCGYISYLVPERKINENDDGGYTGVNVVGDGDDDDEFTQENVDGDNDEEVEAVLLQIHFGIPLFDDKLNAQVLSRMSQLPIIKSSNSVTKNSDSNLNQSNDELSQEPIDNSVEEYEQSMVQLSEGLIRFIHKFSSNEICSKSSASNENCVNSSNQILPSEPIKSLQDLLPYSRELIRPRVCLLFNKGHLGTFPS